LQVAAFLVAEGAQLLDECTITGPGRSSLKHAEAKDFRRFASRFYWESGPEDRAEAKAEDRPAL
jgi:hypothetical protein